MSLSSVITHLRNYTCLNCQASWHKHLPSRVPKLSKNKRNEKFIRYHNAFSPQCGLATQSLTLCCVYHHIELSAPEATVKPTTQEHGQWDFRRSLEFRASSSRARPAITKPPDHKTPRVKSLKPPRTKNKPHRVTKGGTKPTEAIASL